MGRKNNNSLFDSKIKAIEQQNTAWGNVANVWCCKKENVEMAEKEGQLFKVITHVELAERFQRSTEIICRQITKMTRILNILADRYCMTHNEDQYYLVDVNMQINQVSLHYMKEKTIMESLSREFDDEEDKSVDDPIGIWIVPDRYQYH
ncbi:hypothetical protein M9H77_12820 [Catharanthus roseus]|uniref:Uncharacterized protein n=1 Tax=Catharanthus roseus TaxID=4058 RepID=A0ACC0BIJ2_CATRO|nr:hypothetical protein M9H77_12820 [Catharanthus roseus]